MLSPVKIWRNQKKVRAIVGVRGTVVSWTVIRVPPAGFGDMAPYAVVIVALPGDKRIMAQLVDVEPKEVKKGMKVVSVIRRVTQPTGDGVIPYGIKVKPA
jgi:uncharacterized OB-fold protein